MAQAHKLKEEENAHSYTDHNLYIYLIKFGLFYMHHEEGLLLVNVTIANSLSAPP